MFEYFQWDRYGVLKWDEIVPGKSMTFCIIILDVYVLAAGYGNVISVYATDMRRGVCQGEKSSISVIFSSAADCCKRGEYGHRNKKLEYFNCRWKLCKILADTKMYISKPAKLVCLGKNYFETIDFLSFLFSVFL